MDFFEYLKADNPVAQSIIYLLWAFFAIWIGLLLWNLWKNLRYRNQIKRCEDAASLLIHEQGVQHSMATALYTPLDIEKVFHIFLKAKGLEEKSPITKHLRAIFEAGQNESQLDARGLIKNTTDRLFRANSLHRALLSIFIILGLLGTLIGLADTLASLDTLLHGSSQLNNDTLGQGLQHLLGTLRGAFAPSIWGVSLTVLSVLIFAIYLRAVALPLGNLLERMTLTVWIPQLVPTASQKLLDKLQLSERQMQRSFAAAQQVAEFAENIEQKTGPFSDALGLTTETLKQMAGVADRLETFTQNFVEGVKILTPFQQDLRTLYQQMAQESRAFQESVQRNIAGAEDFQKHIQEQLTSQHQQLAQVLYALQSYEAAYIANRQQIDEKLSAVLVQAEQAFHNLGQRNEEVGQVLDAVLGRPLRENLAQNLNAVETALQERLGGVERTLQVQLSSLSERLRELDAPLNVAADNFTDTFRNFNEYTDEWRKTLQREFSKQNETNQQQLHRLDSLSQQIPELLQRLSTSSTNFSESSSSFASNGQQLSQDVTSLSRNIDALSKNVGALSERFNNQHGGRDENRMAELLTQQTRILQELTQRMEKLMTMPSRRPTVAVTTTDRIVRPQPTFRDRVRSWFSFGRR